MSPDEYYRQELEQYRKLWEGGLFPALFEAVQSCAMWQIPLPEWASLGALNCIRSAYENGFIGDGESRGGRHTSRRGRLNMDYRHYVRWAAVKGQLKLRGLDVLPQKRGPPTDVSMTRRAVLHDARQVLCSDASRRSLARPGDKDDSLAQSFELVEASRRNGEMRFMFDKLNAFS